MTIYKLIGELTDIANQTPGGIHSPVVAWVRVTSVGESAVLEVSSVSQGYRPALGGTIATLNLDERA